MMQRKSVSIRGCITCRVEVIVQLLHGNSLCNVLLASNILQSRLPPAHTGAIHSHLLVAKERELLRDSLGMGLKVRTITSKFARC